jgi:ketosteroid isomerase-like protein
MASTAAAQTAPDAAELTKLLNDFLAGASRNDPAVHDRFWAEDLIYTRSAGRRVNKAEIMRDVRSAPAPKPDDPKTVYTAEDIRIQQYGDTAVVAFRLVATTETGATKQVQYLLNCGTFVKRNGKWQVVAWQATRIPHTAEESKADIATMTAALRKAFFEIDAKQITALTDPGFVWTPGSQKEIARDELVAELKKTEKPGGTKLDTPTETISVYGDTAVVRGDSLGIKYTLTLVNQSGTWKAVALHTGK